MKLGQAASYFNDTSIETYDGSKWELTDLKVKIAAYQRFLGPRVFGHKQRVVLAGQSNQIPSNVELFRTCEPRVYLILSMNTDSERDNEYSYEYVVQQVDRVAEIIRLDEVSAPSGIGGSVNEVVETADVHCDYERFSGENARNIDAVSYIAYSFLIPLSVTIDTDRIIRVDGVDFDVREVNPLLNVHEVKASKRGTE